MGDWTVTASKHSLATINPIRNLVEALTIPEDFPKIPINLGLGDPSKYEDFKVHPIVTQAILETLVSNEGNGYVCTTGPYATREFLAERFSYPNIQLTADDVFMDSGGSGAIHTVFQALLNAGDRVLVPTPGFSLYFAIGGNISIDIQSYPLLPDSDWEIDISRLDELYNERTKLVVVINPSNPCGSCFRKQHLLEVLEWASRKKVCVLADEVYHGMTIIEGAHHPLASLTNEVPIFTIGAMSKTLLMPGARCGWVLVYDKYKRCERVKEAMVRIKNMLVHPVSFIAVAIPRIFRELPEDYTRTTMEKVRERAEYVYAEIQKIPHITCCIPQGAFYFMVSLHCAAFRDISTSVEFSKKLAAEQGVVVLPAEAFMATNGFRIVLCNPIEVLREALARIKDFILSHTLN